MKIFLLILAVCFFVTFSIPSSGGGCGPSGSGSSTVLEASTEGKKKKSNPSTGQSRVSIAHFCTFKCLIRCEGEQKAALPIRNCPLTPSDISILAQSTVSCGSGDCYCNDVIDASPADSSQKTSWKAILLLNNNAICRDFGIRTQLIEDRRGLSIEVEDIDDILY